MKSFYEAILPAFFLLLHSGICTRFVEIPISQTKIQEENSTVSGF